MEIGRLDVRSVTKWPLRRKAYKTLFFIYLDTEGCIARAKGQLATIIFGVGRLTPSRHGAMSMGKEIDMPCDSGMSYSGGADYEARREVEKLTRVSCDIMKAIEAAGINIPVSSETAQWWDRHKLIDAAREKAENEQKARHALAEAAKAKLTPTERAALGIR